MGGGLSFASDIAGLARVGPTAGRALAGGCCSSEVAVEGPHSGRPAVVCRTKQEALEEALEAARGGLEEAERKAAEEADRRALEEEARQAHEEARRKEEEERRAEEERRWREAEAEHEDEKQQWDSEMQKRQKEQRYAHVSRGCLGCGEVGFWPPALASCMRFGGHLVTIRVWSTHVYPRSGR